MSPELMVPAPTMRADEPAAEERADDADHDIEKDSLTAVGAHHDAGKPADDAANDQPQDESHPVSISPSSHRCCIPRLAQFMPACRSRW